MILRLLIILHCFTAFSSSLRLKFDPNEKLTQLSSETGMNFFKIVKTSFLNRDYWPLLIAFSEAHYYNFIPVLIATLEQLNCDEVQ